MSRVSSNNTGSGGMVVAESGRARRPASVQLRDRSADGDEASLDPATKSLTPVAKDFDKPNGLCFSPDESKLYVADSGKPRHIRVFAIGGDGKASGGEVFATIDKGGPDGIRCDSSGRVWSSSGDGAQIFAADGKLIARILLPEAAANLGFGGPKGRTLYLTARKSLYAVETLATQAKRPKRR